MAALIILIVILFFYTVLILITVLGFIKTPIYHPTTQPAKTKFSVVIAYKNESENLPLLLDSLQKLIYPKDLFEIILIDDYSTDKSFEIVSKYNFVKNLKTKGKGKKAALKTGIRQARYPWIITTDADCILPTDWLKIYNDFICEKDPKMILGPVKYFDSPHFIDQLQQFEFLSLQGFTVAFTYLKKPFLANGANLAFNKQAFYDVGGYEGNQNIASGDDVFLLEKFTETFPQDIYFLKSEAAILQTKTQTNWPELLQQKIRWASKSKYQRNYWGKIAGFVSILANLSVFLAVFLQCWWYLGLKFLWDIALLKMINNFYKVRLNWWYFIPVFLMYPVYLIMVGILSLKGNFVWKERKIKI